MKKIAAVCKSVQALPLAIELAAAWLNVLSLDEIKAEVEQSFDILSSEMRGVPWQRCQFHLQHNASAYVPRRSTRL